MKIAVCVSGLLAGDEYLQRNNEVLKRKFPTADFYYATWSTEANKFFEFFPSEQCFIFEEPLMHYHPYSRRMLVPEAVNFYYKRSISGMFVAPKRGKRDVEEVAARRKWLLHSTKQILLHAMLLNKIKKEYDIIVRVRFDTYIWNSEKVNFSKFIRDSFKYNRVHGFGVGFNNNHTKLYKNPQLKTKEAKLNYRVLDFMIIHPRHMINYDQIIRLHGEKMLRGGEYGWHQLLSEPYSNSHRNWRGWMTKSDFLEEKYENKSTDL